MPMHDRSVTTHHGDSHAPMTPVAIGGCAGWLHEGRSRTGVVLCGAQGFEALCTRQSARVLADCIAAAGPHVLRFDYPGEGDSLDVDGDAGLASAWIDSILQAADWLRRERGSTEVVLVGLRLGAMLALEAAQAGAKPSALVLVAPPASGAAYWREMKATARMLAATKLGCGVSDTQVDLCGFESGPAHQSAFAALKPAAIASAPAPSVLIAEPVERPCEGLAEMLDALGVSVERLGFEGYAEMLATPTGGAVPYALFERIGHWLSRPSAPVPASTDWPKSIEGQGFREESVTFGEGGRLAGVLCEPVVPAPHCPTVVMLNAGAISHIGWARMSVEHARELARRGISSLRFDLGGIGDSAWVRAGVRKLLYSRQHVSDVRVALDFLEQRGHRAFTLMGLCAGGYVALHAAHQDARVVSLVPVNVDKLVWHDHYDIDVIEQELNQSSSSYAAQAFTGAAWKRILSGDVSAQRIVAILKLLSTKALARMVDPLGAAMGIETGLSEDDRLIRSVFAELDARGTSVRLVYADRDPGIDELDRHMGVQARFLRSLGKVDIEVIADADHEFTPAPAREALLQLIVATVQGKAPAAQAA